MKPRSILYLLLIAGILLTACRESERQTAVRNYSDPAVSYEILCRETDQPEWQVLGVVSAMQTASSFQCPLSKDNYFFAVRSVDDGHPSLPSVAR